MQLIQGMYIEDIAKFTNIELADIRRILRGFLPDQTIDCTVPVYFGVVNLVLLPVMSS